MNSSDVLSVKDPSNSWTMNARDRRTRSGENFCLFLVNVSAWKFSKSIFSDFHCPHKLFFHFAFIAIRFNNMNDSNQTPPNTIKEKKGFSQKLFHKYNDGVYIKVSPAITYTRGPKVLNQSIPSSAETVSIFVVGHALAGKIDNTDRSMELLQNAWSNGSQSRTLVAYSNRSRRWTPMHAEADKFQLHAQVRALTLC